MTDSEQLRFGPPRDRRRGKRIFTLNNFLIALFVGVLVFAAISIRSEMRPEKPGDFGRLYGSRTIETPPPVQKPIVIREQEISDQSGTDPMLVHSGDREEYLGVVRPVAPSGVAPGVVPDAPPVSASATSFPAPEQPVVDTLHHDERLVLTGGPDGVRLDVKKAP